VDKRFTEEILRAQRYLTSLVTPLLQKILEDTLITPHLTAIIYLPNSGMDSMIDTDKIQSLTQMYRLFKRVAAGIPTIRKAFKDSIIRRGNEINMNAEFDVAEEPGEGEGGSKGKGKAKPKMTGPQTLQQALRWVQDVLDLKDKFNRVWSEAFNLDRELETALVEVKFRIAYASVVLWNDFRVLKDSSTPTRKLLNSYRCLLTRISRRELRM
jgi:cullin 3